LLQQPLHPRKHSALLAQSLVSIRVSEAESENLSKLEITKETKIKSNKVKVNYHSIQAKTAETDLPFHVILHTLQISHLAALFVFLLQQPLHTDKLKHKIEKGKCQPNVIKHKDPPVYGLVAMGLTNDA
jgi:hypothetical protein